MKLVDTKDLKSLPFWECQFESGRGHQKKMKKLNIISDKNPKSQKIKKDINNILKDKIIKKKNLIIVIGGDGFMLQTLKKYKNTKKSFYGINSGNYGFLMNKFSKNKYFTFRDESYL